MEKLNIEETIPRILFVCLGNICRSPMAEAVFCNLLENKGLANNFKVDSAGTAAYHVGEFPDKRTLAVLEENQIFTKTKARQIKSSDFMQFDFILAMDQDNYDNILKICPPAFKDKVHKFGNFAIDTLKGADVRDPYYGTSADFKSVFNHVSDLSAGFLAYLTDRKTVFKSA